MGVALRAELADDAITVHNLIVGSIDIRMAAHVRASKARDPAALEQQMAAALKLETLHTGR